MENINYYLVLENRPGDYNLVDISKLDISDNINSNDIAAIDSFTLKYTDSEIKSAIAISNIVQPSYLNGNLKVISDAKHNFKALTKDIFDTISSFQTNSMVMDQNFKNRLFGVYKKIITSIFKDEDFIKQLLEKFKISLREDKKDQVFKIIGELPYYKSRELYFVVYEELEKRDKDKSRRLEKMSDAI